MALFQMPLMYAVALIVETLMCLQQESRWVRLETFFFFVVFFFFLQLSAGSNFNSLTCSYSQ